MERIAIVGSGIAGLSCAYLISKESSFQRKITLYEREDYLGGHSNTVDFEDQEKKRIISVDTGFIVYNELNYPNLTRFFKESNVTTENSDMSFGFSQNGFVEWAGESLSTVFAQPKNLFSIAFWYMLRDITRFGREAPRILGKKEYEKITVGEYLKINKYSQGFIEYYLLPMTSAIWSTSVKDMDEFPIQTMIHFMHNHQMLQINNRPQWKTVTNGSREYVRKIQQHLEKSNADIRLSTPVISVRREEKEGNVTILVTERSGKIEVYDKIVFACHADTALSILQDPTSEEKNFLNCFPYSTNIAYLHSDESLMPQIRKVWSSWNYLMFDKSTIILSYWMNRLQPFLPKDQTLIITLNPHKKPKNIIKEIKYEHPQYLPKSIDAQKKLQEYQGKKNTYYCGAYCGFGFHEDGFISGARVAKFFGSSWNLDLTRYEYAPIEKRDKMSFRLLLALLIIVSSFILLF